MNLAPMITDNVAEVLVKIIEFTQARQKVLTRNINSVHCPGFIPEDLAVQEFSSLMNNAVSEHIQNRRLLLCDSENIKFGPAGSFQVKPVPDKHAKRLLKEDSEEYIELQINKLLENRLNQRIAAELLSQKQGITSILE